MANDLKRMPTRCEKDDPNRCQYDHPKRGQCVFLAVPGKQNCPMHNASSHIEEVRSELYAFKKAEVAKNLSRFRDHADSRSLAIELALCRHMLEEAINKFDQPYDLIMNEATISRLLANVRDTLKDNVKLEEKYGDLLSLDQVTEIMHSIFAIISHYVEDPDTLNAISYAIEDLLND